MFITFSALALVFQTWLVSFIQIHVSDPVLVALISAVPALLAAIIGLHNLKAIQAVHIDLNSRLTQLILASVDKGRVAERSDIALGIQSAPLVLTTQKEEK
jgi:hypothetical protein